MADSTLTLPHKMSQEEERLLFLLQSRQAEEACCLYARLFWADLSQWLDKKFNSSNWRFDADIIITDSFLAIYEEAQKENFQINSSLKVYIYRVVKNMTLREINQQERFSKRVQLIDEFAPDLFQVEESQERAPDIDKLRQLLGESDREILDLKLRGLSQKELASKLGLTENSVKTKISRWYQRVRNLYEQTKN